MSRTHRESFWVNIFGDVEEVILLDHVVSYRRLPLPYDSHRSFTVLLANGNKIAVPMDRLEEFEDAMYGRV